MIYLQQKQVFLYSMCLLLILLSLETNFVLAGTSHEQTIGYKFKIISIFPEFKRVHIKTVILW